MFVGECNFISIHALREEGDVWSVRTTARPIIFLSTPSARRATLLWEHWKEFMGISIHALREEGDGNAKDNEAFGYQISIHALREEGDTINQLRQAFQIQFLSTPSARRATKAQDEQYRANHHFYPRPPRGGRPLMQTDTVTQSLFLSTPSARRATGSRRPGPAASSISIHALREEGDVQRVIDCVQFFEFLSTPSARRATSFTGLS